MARRYIQAQSLTGLSEVAAQFGEDASAALKSFGMSPRLLRERDVQIDFFQYCQLLEHCAERWNLPDLAFRMAPFQHLEILGPVALVTRMERNLRDALRAILRNLLIYTNNLIAAMEEQDDTAAIVLSVQTGDTVIRQYRFLALAVTKNVLEQAAGSPIRFVEASFSEVAEGKTRTAEAWFGCPVRFGAARTALYFDRAVLDRELEKQDTAYHSIIRRFLSTTRDEAGLSVSDGARDEIARQMEISECTLESVARAMRMEPRGLQRRLKAEGASFRELVDNWRRDRAMSLVTMTRIPLSDVADALGYAHQAVFTRAFSRWHGITPLACRQRTMDVEGRP